MKNNRIKLFEDFQEQYTRENEVLESIYSDWKKNLNFDLDTLYEYLVSEEIVDDEEREYTSGEKAALARDFQILTKAQMAAIYLRALGKAEDNYYGKYLLMIPGIEAFGDYDKNRKFVISKYEMADALGMESYVTVLRTTRKFVNLISGEGETPSESIGRKVQNYFEEFRELTPTNLAQLAAKAIQDTSYTKNRDKAPENVSKSAARAKKRKEEEIKLGETVFALIKSLKQNPLFSEHKKAQRAAIMRIARDSDIDPVKVELSLQKFLASKDISSFYKK